MASISRRVLLLALLVTVALTAFARADCDANCQTCVLGFCTSCKSGYYHGPSGCTSCLSAHCSRCEAVGWCLKCESGYRLQYVANAENLTVNQYGKCVNGAAATVSTVTALIGAAAALAYAVTA